jgi:response regulator RpfG family c-di-GMP phosphodiesterase
MSVAHVVNQRIADRLLVDGRIGPAEHRQVVDHAARNRGRIEDAIVDLGILPESDLLRYIATAHKTRFVSSEKLSKASIDARVLSKVSRKSAEAHLVFPVLYDDDTQRLSVVTPDPDNGAALDELKLAAGAKEVRALVARPATVKAAIAHYYHGDAAAFAVLSRPMMVLTELPDVAPFEHTLPAQRAAPPPPRAAQPDPFATPLPPQAAQGAALAAGLSLALPTPGTPPGVQVPIASPHLPWAAPQPPAFTGSLPAPPVPAAPTPSTPPPLSAASSEFLEALNVLVTLLETSRGDLRGHSSRTARHTKRVCERMSLAPSQTAAIVAAAYLHDLGKAGPYHLTSLNVAEYEGHQVNARKALEMPARLTESIHLLPETISTMGSMYERYDGKGFPLGLVGKDIPLGARILAVVDTFADVTQNPRNPFRKALRTHDACVELQKLRGSVFDPNVVDLVVQMMTTSDLRDKILADRRRALLVDTDPEETTVLELRLTDQGFEVKIARSSAQARRELEAGEFDVVVCEVDLEEADAGLTLRAWAKDAKPDITWVVFTRKADRATAQRAFDLGVDDFVSKPAAADILAAKLRQFIERRTSTSGRAGVTGTLDEMALPDVVQILWHGRKTCALRISVPGGSSGEIHFAEGQVVNASFGSFRGEEAFYRMVALRDGQFRIDLAYKPGTRVISASPEALLLEAMRLIDEGVIGAAP